VDLFGKFIFGGLLNSQRVELVLQHMLLIHKVTQPFTEKLAHRVVVREGGLCFRLWP